MNPNNTKEALQAFLDHAVPNLARETGLDINARVLTLEPKADGKRADALVDLWIAGEQKRYVTEFKANVDRYVQLGQLKALVQEFEQPGLLLTPYVTPAIAKRCRDLDIAFIDGIGNAYIKTETQFILLTGNRIPVHQLATNRADEMMRRAVAVQLPRRLPAANATALRVIFALLCQPDLINAPYRQIQQAAEVALGAIGWVFFDLQERGLIVGKQPARRFVDKPRLFEEWVVNYPLKLRPKLNAMRFRAPDPEWWRGVKLGTGDAYWGGEVAGERLTNYLTPVTQTIYVKPERRKETLAGLVGTHRLHADYQGNIEILDAFWHFRPNIQETDVVPPMLAYADLVATADPRNIETARLIRERYVEDALR